MKNLFKLFICTIILSALIPSSTSANELNKFSELVFAKQGSCETRNLSFNATRFSKIDLKRKSVHNLDLYLQLIIFIKEDGSVNVRSTEMGLTGCKETPEGPVCGYRPYPETKKLTALNYSIENDQLIIHNLGTISKIRDDFPWLGFELVISDNFFLEEARGQKIIGGKVQVNFDDQDRSVMSICK